MSSAPVQVVETVFVERDSFAAGAQPDGNSVIFAGPRGLVIVDTGRHLAHAQALLDFATDRKQPIVAVVNSHWHLDHLGGNAWLRERAPGLRILASEAVAPALDGWLADSRRQMLQMLADPRTDAGTAAMLRTDVALIEQGPRLLPDITVAAPREIDFGGQTLRIGHEGPAATVADLWVYDPATQVLAAGDLVTLPAPFLDTACAPGWRAALAHLDAVPFKTLVPGHGAPMSREDFGTWRRAFGLLLDCASGSAPTAACAAGWVDALGRLLPDRQRKQALGMTGYYVDHHLRAEPARRDAFCKAETPR